MCNSSFRFAKHFFIYQITFKHEKILPLLRITFLNFYQGDKFKKVVFMATSRTGVQYPSRQSSKSTGKYVQPRVKLSMLGRAYNKVRWACYFLPVIGFLIIGYGLYIALYYPAKDIPVAQTVIAAGAVVTYLAIYYNKRT